MSTSPEPAPMPPVWPAPAEPDHSPVTIPGPPARTSLVAFVVLMALLSAAGGAVGGFLFLYVSALF